jgi:hypothetical protein
MPSQPGLVVSPNLPAGTSRLGYVRGSVANPVCVAVAVFAGCIGLGYAGLLAAVLAVLAVLVIGVHAARYRLVRSYVDSQARARESARRECRRLKLLEPTGATRQQHYQELRVLVEEIERLDDPEATRFELQDLLDHFVGLAVNHQRCVDSLRLSGANALPATPPIGEAAKSKRCREIIQRRIRHRDDCVQRMERIADELECIDEMVRLIAQRTAGPLADGDLDRELDRRLWELDEVDAALHQLSA